MGADLRLARKTGAPGESSPSFLYVVNVYRRGRLMSAHLFELGTDAMNYAESRVEPEYEVDLVVYEPSKPVHRVGARTRQFTNDD